MAAKDIRIEFPSRGSTYCRKEFGVYEYDEYPRGSVLEGQSRRKFLGSFLTIEEAQDRYPQADITGCGFQAPSVNHLSDENDI